MTVAAAAICILLSAGAAIANDKPTGIIKASDLIGKNVQNTEGKNLGEIKDLAIDPIEGEILYAVLSFGGFLGVGDKYFAIPWDAMALDEDRKHFVLDVSKRDLKDAPGFDKDNWPDMSDRNWAVVVYDFYEVPPP
jgi:sporulation protein YlmC with PRC-barrel domain